MLLTILIVLAAAIVALLAVQNYQQSRVFRIIRRDSRAIANSLNEIAKNFQALEKIGTPYGNGQETGKTKV